MKKLLISFIAIIFISSMSLNSSAQDYRSTVSAGVGQSMVKAISDIFINKQVLDEAGLTYNSLPAFFLNYDFYVNDWFSVGAAGSFQMFKLTEDATGDYAQVNRMNFALRTLFHYGDNERLDMYSGVRFGTTLWDLNSNIAAGDPTVDDAITEIENFANKFRIVPQIVAFGIKGYFTDNIGAHLEISVGAPYYLSGGVNFRF